MEKQNKKTTKTLISTKSNMTRNINQFYYKPSAE